MKYPDHKNKNRAKDSDTGGESGHTISAKHMRDRLDGGLNCFLRAWRRPRCLSSRSIPRVYSFVSVIQVGGLQLVPASDRDNPYLAI